MKRLALLLLLLASPAFAQRGNIYSTKAQEEFSKALTEGVLFGVPRYTTVALPICDATQVGALAWNTTTNTLWGCNGSAWGAVDSGGGGGSVTPGVTPFTGCTNQFVIADGGSFLNCDAGLTYNATTNAAALPGFLTVGAGMQVATGNSTFLGGVNFGNQSAVGLLRAASAPPAVYLQLAGLTPDGPAFATETTSNSWHFGENGDLGFDFNNGPCLLAACTDPTFIIHSHNQATGEYLSFHHDGVKGVINGTVGLTLTTTGTLTAPGHTETSGGFVVNPQLTMSPGGFSAFGGLGSRTENTPDTTMLYTGTNSNAISFREGADATFDMNNGPCGTAACTDPTLNIYSHNQTTTEWLALRHDGTSGVISSGLGAVAFPGGGTGSLVLGAGAVASASGGLAIGTAATTSAGSQTTVIGTNAVGGGNNSVVIGHGAAANSTGNVIIGQGSTTTGTITDCVGIGRANSTKGSNCIAIGAGAVAINSSAIAIGSASGASSNSVAIGVSASAPGASQFVAGSGSSTYTDVYFGKGVTNATATAYTINGTGGTGANNAGAALQLAGGLGTGTAAGGDVRLQRSPSIATGSTAQTLADAYLIRSQKKDLTAGTATAFVRVNLAAGTAAITGWTGGTVHYTLVANDATDFQSRSGSIPFSVVNKASAETCAFGTASAESIANSAGTTTLTFDTDVAGPTDGCDLRAIGASSLTETTLALFYSVVMNGPGTLTPQ